MAKNDTAMLVLVGAIIALFMAIASMFVEQLAFFNASATGPITWLLDGDSMWISAFWGGYDWINGETIYFNKELVKVLPGILIVVGAVLCFMKQRNLALIGSILMIIGVLLWGVNLADYFTEILNKLYLDPEDYTIFDMISGKEKFFLSEITWNIGIGFWGCLVGSFLALVGSIKR